MPDRPTARLASVGCLAALAIVLSCTGAGALTINLSAVQKGDTIPFFGLKATAGPSSHTGTGTLGHVMRNAGKLWEKAIGDPHRTDISYAWAKLEDGVLGSTMRSGNRAAIALNPRFSWHIDATPGKAEEFKAMRKDYAVVDGKRMTVGRYSAAKPSGAAALAFDLPSVAHHEIAHAIGAWFHVIYKDALLAPTLPKGVRRHVSSADAYLTADYAGYSNPRAFNLLAPIPAPGALPLMASALAALGALVGLRRLAPRAAA